MINTLPKYVAFKFQCSLRWLFLIGILLLSFTIGTSPTEKGEMPNIYNAISGALFIFWFFFSFSVYVAVSYFKEKPDVPVSSFWIQITSSSWYIKLSSSRSLLWLDRKWSAFAYFMFMLMFYGLALFGLFGVFMVMIGYAAI